MIRKLTYSIAVAVLALAAEKARAQDPLTETATAVNKNMVKLFGIGGFKGLPSYGTGIVVSKQGHILTVNNHILNTPGILVHRYDGRQYQAKLVAREPNLDVALLKVDEDVSFLRYYEFEKEAARPLGGTGDWVMALSNQFKIALRDEPMSVQRGVVATLADLKGRRGVFDAPFNGDVYFLDNVTNNPGAAGGALANLKGDLLGIIGRELKDTRTDTWINYAVPIQSAVDVQREENGKVVTEKVTMAKFVKEAIEGKYKEGIIAKREDKGAYSGIILVVNAVSSTPPYVEEVVNGSPASKVGLRPDDLILYVNGVSVPTIKAYREEMKQFDPGTKVDMRVQRGARLESVSIELTQAPKVAAPK